MPRLERPGRCQPLPAGPQSDGASFPSFLSALVPVDHRCRRAPNVSKRETINKGIRTSQRVTVREIKTGKGYPPPPGTQCSRPRAPLLFFAYQPRLPLLPQLRQPYGASRLLHQPKPPEPKHRQKFTGRPKQFETERANRCYIPHNSQKANVLC